MSNLRNRKAPKTSSQTPHGAPVDSPKKTKSQAISSVILASFYKLFSRCRKGSSTSLDSTLTQKMNSVPVFRINHMLAAVAFTIFVIYAIPMFFCAQEPLYDISHPNGLPHPDLSTVVSALTLAVSSARVALFQALPVSITEKMPVPVVNWLAAPAELPRVSPASPAPTTRYYCPPKAPTSPTLPLPACSPLCATAYYTRNGVGRVLGTGLGMVGRCVEAVLRAMGKPEHELPITDLPTWPLFRFGQPALSALHDAMRTLLPPEQRLKEMAGAAMRTAVLRALVKLHVPDAVHHAQQEQRMRGERATGVSVSTLARMTCASEPHLLRLLRAAAVDELLREDTHGLWHLTPQSRLLREDHPHSFKAAAALMGGEQYVALSSLHLAVLSGQPAFKEIYGDFWQYHADGQREWEHFQARAKATGEYGVTPVRCVPWVPRGAALADQVTAQRLAAAESALAEGMRTAAEAKAASEKDRESGVSDDGAGVDGKTEHAVVNKPTAVVSEGAEGAIAAVPPVVAVAAAELGVRSYPYELREPGQGLITTRSVAVRAGGDGVPVSEEARAAVLIQAQPRLNNVRAPVMLAAREFHMGMTALAASAAYMVARDGNFGEFDTVVDVAGGRGHLLQEVMKVHPSVSTGVLFDLPGVYKDEETAAAVRRAMHRVLAVRQGYAPQLLEAEKRGTDVSPQALGVRDDDNICRLTQCPLPAATMTFSNHGHADMSHPNNNPHHCHRAHRAATLTAAGYWAGYLRDGELPLCPSAFVQTGSFFDAASLPRAHEYALPALQHQMQRVVHGLANGSTRGAEVAIVGGQHALKLRHRAVYVMMQILHDWSDEDSVRILRNVREAMIAAPDHKPEELCCGCGGNECGKLHVPLCGGKDGKEIVGQREVGCPHTTIEYTSKLYVVDRILTKGNLIDTQGSNFADVLMMNNFNNARERYISDMQRVLSDGGFRLLRIVPTRSFYSIVEAEPILH